MTKTYFYLPGFFVNKNLNVLLIKLMNNMPEAFYPDVEIGAIYDCFPDSTWDGGRSIDHSYRFTREEMEQTVRLFNDMGIPIRYTFTNSKLKKEHLQDEYCRMAMDVANNGMNEVVTNSEILEEEILKCWPSYRIVSSLTKCHFTTEELNEDFAAKRENGEDKFSLVIMPFHFNNNLAFIQELNDLDRLEMLINEYCVPDCPFKKVHYEITSLANLEHKNCIFRECPGSQKVVDFYTNLNNPSSIPAEQLEVYKQMGIRHFKITGRYQSAIYYIEAIVYYMCVPEYRDHIRMLLLRQVFENGGMAGYDVESDFEYKDILKKLLAEEGKAFMSK